MLKAVPAAAAFLSFAALLCLEAQSAPDYTRDIQPIFEKNCYACHGPKVQSGGLRLDQPAMAAAHTAEIYRRVSGTGDAQRMPLGGAQLPADQLALLRTWSESAPKPKHWAFIPPVRPALPAVNRKDWVRNPIDTFVLAKLESEGLHPSPEAGRATLLRRLSLDLIGLPPTPGEVDAFVNDKSPNAYEKQVDRLLASPHYGEKWARHWLDAARYADSDGYEKDKPRFVWAYRDWVIDSFNRNLPYNRFVIDQIAGDLLPNPTQDENVATGFLRNSMINEEGGVDPEQFRMEAMYDRMDAIGKGILGVTIQCAQCHNHKYDPLTQEEYYRMFAFLNNSNESNIAVYSPGEQIGIAGILRRTREIEGELQRRMPGWQDRMSAWEDSVAHDQPAWQVVHLDVDDISTGGQRYIPQDDGSLLAQGYAPTKHTVKLTGTTSLKNIRAFRLELMNDPNLPLGGPGRSIKGTGALTEFKVEAAPAESPEKPVRVEISHASADINLPETPLEAMFYDKSKRHRVTGPVEFAIDGKDETSWGIDAGPGLRNLPRKAVFNAAAPISNPGDTILTFYLRQNAGGWNSDDNQNNNLGRFRLSVTSAPGAVADPLPAHVRAILAIPRAQRSALQNAAVFSYWRTTVPEWKAENDAIAGIWREYPEGSSQLVLNERANPRTTHQLIRGDFLNPGKVVTAGVPSFLNPLPADEPVNRLAFAKWLVARDAPTTARAFVNRLWLEYFGIGIVETVEDLGTQSSPPSHPQLLDWLAVEFMDRGWDIKAIQRLIVTSAAYRQSSNITPELLSKDPYNRLLARGPRFRVDGEIVRDIALEASGLLNPKVGGPSVYPPAPGFLFLPPASYGPKVWNEANGQDKYRRALYTFRFRSVPYPMLQTFDTPNGESSCVRRARSDTPLQALTTLNEPLFLEAARALALKTLTEGGSTEQSRLNYASRRVLSRIPTSEESNVLLGLLEKEQQRFSGGTRDPLAFEPAVPAGVRPAEAAAWTAVSRVLLNLDEAITKE
ncbi:MAG: PSD1 domain-containing protein [Acidobacteriota bacterium]|nr:PSD1 domain-containing protein [Acidobacteriota bacterium]